MSLLNSLDKLRSTGGNKWASLCPAHENKTNRTLTIKQIEDGSYLCHCFSCGANGVDVFKALGLPLDELFGFKDRPRQVLTQRQRDEYEIDKIVVQIFSADKEVGKVISHSDYKRNRLAQARIVGIESIINS